MQLHQWMKALAHFYGLVGETQGVVRDIEPTPGPVEELCGGGEAFIDPRQAPLRGDLASHLNYAGEQVDLFYDASGRLCLITHRRDGSTSVNGQPDL
jgi:YD repeat-containing protein